MSNNGQEMFYRDKKSFPNLFNKNLITYDDFENRYPEPPKDSFAIQKGSAILTRKFTLVPDTTTIHQRKHAYSQMTNIFVKIVSLKNLYVQKLIKHAKSGNLDDFRSSSMIDARKVYDLLNLSSLDGSTFSKSTSKSFKLKERVKQCADFDAFNVVRNWLVRNENLRVIISFLISKLKNDNDFALKFLSGKLFSSNDLNEIWRFLETNCFDRKQNLSTFYLNNHIYQLRNVFLKTVDFTSNLLNKPQDTQNELQQNFAEILLDLKVSSEFVKFIANGFTKKEKRKVIIVPEDELLEHLLNQYFRKIKWITNGLAQRIIALRKKIYKISFQTQTDKRQNLIRQLKENLNFIETKLFSFIKPFKFATKEEFRRERDFQLDKVKSQFQIEIVGFKIADIYQVIKNEFDNEIDSIYESNNSYVLKRLFKPNFPSIRIFDVNFDSLTQYIRTRIRYKIRKNLNRFFTTDCITKLFIDEFKNIKSHLYDIVSIPKFRNFSLNLIMNETFRENYSKYDKNNPESYINLDILDFKLGFISHQFIPFKIIDKNNRLQQLLNKFTPANPTITFKNRKLILNLPFEIKKGQSNPSQEQDSNNLNIEMGIDLGLINFAVISVRDKNQKIELARYFLGTRQLFDKKLVEQDKCIAQDNGKKDTVRVLRWQNQDRFNAFPYDRQSNVKLKLINLRKQIKQLQRKKNNYEQCLLEKGINNFRSKLKWNKIRKELSLCWDRLNRLNKQIVNLLNNYVLKIACFWKVSTIKMEELRWVTHSKKRDAGKFMAFWQTHWFYSQVQNAVKFQCDLNSIRFQRVPAGLTSQKCSHCGELGSRTSKQFSCPHCGLKLDSDLNAARNIAKYQNNNTYYINSI